MKKNKIFVEDFYSYKNVVDYFGETTEDIKNFFEKPEEFKLILFSGGADINPTLYGHKSPDRLCYYNKSRDTLDIKIFKHAIKNNIKMVGICRGLQFLNVMSGGSMIHHANNHNASHSFISPRMNYEIKVNSLHHQIVIPHKNTFTIGTTKKQLSKIYFGDNDLPITKHETDIEALYMPSIQACGVQYHPEMMQKHSDGFHFFYKLVDEFLHLEENKFRQNYTINTLYTLGMEG